MAAGLNRAVPDDDIPAMPIAATPVADEDGSPPDLQATAAVTLLPTRATLLGRMADQAAASGASPVTLVLVGLLRRDTGWPMPGAHLDQVAAALSANVRGDDWLARSGPAEFAVLLGAAEHDAETATNRLLEVVAGAGLPGITACAGIAELAPDTSPSEVHRRATLCLTAARSIGGGRVIRYRGSRR
ncbi:diguanylate cyclase domain-containing protein [Modestobacter sp. VKM Ac-2984]|uniref:diguanylate cyclase domain-containing protein n=1 Tax=Modestobacter sp. VKM Ac-2984 TaxID=3004138 RepID=UPI0022AA1A91|nr:diguanylate cyclase [Modestobacter sp. VKM Ac-2984]MCZ2817322.1 diguanylate cyclase [Modestobacter sp. VKM Ac-2984]